MTPKRAVLEAKRQNLLQRSARLDHSAFDPDEAVQLMGAKWKGFRRARHQGLQLVHLPVASLNNHWRNTNPRQYVPLGTNENLGMLASRVRLEEGTVPSPPRVSFEDGVIRFHRAGRYDFANLRDMNATTAAVLATEPDERLLRIYVGEEGRSSWTPGRIERIGSTSHFD